MNGYNLLALWVFYNKKNWSVKKYYKNSMRISYLIDLQEGQFIPQYYYFQIATNM